MNPKELNAKKKVVVNNKSSLKTGVQQVFVLPPNLLQKLGINLGNVQSTSTHHYHDLDQSMSSSSKSTRRKSNKESSFVKTASLMKQSVFLSPTFINSGISTSIHSPKSQAFEECNAKTINTAVTDIDKSESSVLTTQFNIITDKAGLSNDNNDPQVLCKSVNTDKPKLSKETKNTINIISEETITINKLKELQALKTFSTKESMVPASLNTLIVKKIKNNSDLQSPICSENITEKTDAPVSDSNNSLIGENVHTSLVLKRGSKYDHVKQTENCDTIEIQKSEKCISNTVFVYDIFDNKKTQSDIFERSELRPQNIDALPKSDKLSQSKNNTFNSNNDIHSLNISIEVAHNNDLEYHKKDVKTIYEDNTNTDLLVQYNNLNELEINDDTQNEKRHLSDNIKIYGKNEICINNGELQKNNTKTLNEICKQEENIQSMKNLTSIEPHFFTGKTYTKKVNKNRPKSVSSVMQSIKGLDVTSDGLKTISNITDSTPDNLNNNHLNIVTPCLEIIRSTLPNDLLQNIETNTDNDQLLLESPIHQQNIKDTIQSKAETSKIFSDNLNKSNDSLALDKTGSGEIPRISSDVNIENSLNKMENSENVTGVEKIMNNPENPTQIENSDNPKHTFKTFIENTLFLMECLKPQQTIFNNNEQDSSYLKMTLNPERNKLVSKLCIQGVEKPGGKEKAQDQKSLKTYINNKRNKLTDNSFSVKKVNNIKKLEFDVTDVQQTNYSVFLSNVQQFCICKDFGFLPYDDSYDNDYEHIHFLGKKSTECGPDVIFSIYDDNEIYNDEERTANYIHIKESDDEIISIDCICWNRPDLIEDHAGSGNSMMLIDRINLSEGDVQVERKNNVHNNSIPELDNRNDTNILLKHMTRKRKLSIGYNVEESKLKKINTTGKISCVYKVQAVKNPEKEQDTELRRNSLKASVQEKQVKKAVPDKSVICGVCKQNMKYTQWSEHIASHNYIAWKEGEKPFDVADYNKLRKHLNTILNDIGVLICAKCGLEHRYAKAFVTHLKTCSGADISNTTFEQPQIDVENLSADKSRVIKCGVCKEEVTSEQWIEHIKQEHEYKAWEENEPSIDFDDEESLRSHLYNIVKKYGALQCRKCGKSRKYVKLYLQHINSCTGPDPNETLNSTYEDWDSILDITSADDTVVEGTKIVKCGVCMSEMEAQGWLDHIQKEHNYLSWQVGRKPLDLKDEEVVRRYLHSVVQKLGALVCAKCGKARKYVKMYLQHVETCTGPSVNGISSKKSCSNGTNSTPVRRFRPSAQEDKILDVDMDSEAENSSVLDNSNLDVSSTVTFKESQELCLVKCNVCKQEIDSTLWIDHIQQEHNYKSWQEGQEPLNFEDKEELKHHFKNIILKAGQLLCARCKVACKSVKLYLQHIETCAGNVIIKCGVCHKEMKDSSWMKHISINHEYIAWKDTDTELDLSDYDSIWQHLMGIIKEEGPLRCVECGLTRKYPKAYLLHVRDCYGKIYTLDNSVNNSLNGSQATDMDTTRDCSRIPEDDANETRSVKCGVCAEEMEAGLWLEHIHKTHNYLAWREGATPIDLENETSIKNHLQSVEQKYGRLTCPKCGLIKRKILQFYRHMKSCDGTEPGQDSISKWEIRSTGATVKCGVCHAEMNDCEWIAHIAKDHSYLAWREGEKPISRDDETAYQSHLNRIIQQFGELTCSLCGLNRKYARSYLHHIRACTGPEVSTRDSNEAPPKELTGVMVKCGLCPRKMDDSHWFDHIKGHNYVAWKDNETPLVLDTEELVREHLYNIVEKTGQLICKKCGMVRKYVKSFLQHIEGCQGITWKTINQYKIKKEKGDIVRCGVCQVQLDDTEWLEHICQRHNYLAWRDRDRPINLEDQSEVRNHLKRIIQEEGFVQCAKCGVQRKYPKKYLEHLKECDGIVIDEVDESQNEISIFDEIDSDMGVKSVKCGVCQQDVLKAQWIQHIRMEHQYVAWIEGNTPIDINDKEEVYKHLYAIGNKYNGLVCGSCGVVRKYVKSYLSHVNTCIEKFNYDNSEELLECGVCGDKMKGKAWRHHAMQQHYNVAWVVGDVPIDIKSFHDVERYLKGYCEYKQKMKCHICGLTRSSCAGFYAHILTCGKTEEEKEEFKEVCDICSQKYLCIYKTQHYAAHKAQELAKERKMKAEQKPIKEEETDDTNISGRRRAAEKARSVIGDYAAKLSAGLKCESCGLESDSKKELEGHYCDKSFNKYDDCEDSDVSIQLEEYDGQTSDSDDDESSSDASNDEVILTPGKRKRNRHGAKYPSKTSRMPYTVKDPKSYLQESTEDYFRLFNTSERLFPQWQDCTYEEVSKDLLAQYMPPLEESCKLKVGKDGWIALKRFEAKEVSNYCMMFTGGCIQCIAWVPPDRAGSARRRSLLAAACHRAADPPRLRPAHTPAQPALVQMWDFDDFNQPPKLAYGLAHDYGIVWSLDWCPSGARDVLEPNKEGGKRSRIGLMAMACSNGSAYIVPVPYPEDNRNGVIPFYKIKPCVELRLNRGAIKYQATSIHWVLEKEYTTILVGYGDGTTAVYDLVTESPLLKSTEGDITILYPFKDERAHNSCITGLTSNLQGAVCSFSPTGVMGAAGPGGGARPLRAHSALAATTGVFTPHWPSVLLSGDDTIVGHSLSELEWGQAGRRVGAVRAAAACPAGGGRGARVLAAVPPLLLTMRPHPVHSQGHRTLHKKAVAMIDIRPLAKKRSKHINDELSMKLEPLTYEDAIKLYGIEFNTDKDMNKMLVQKHMSKLQEPWPERFPLADVVALACCPSPLHCRKLAVATHAGVIFLMDV